jgi:hypothetical protein
MYLHECVFYLYDGMVFFGFDEQKIKRIRGIPARWHDHYSLKKYLFFKIFLFVMFVLVA